MMNIINGGAHADNSIDFQEFMIIPVAAKSSADSIRIGAEVFHTLKKTSSEAGLNTAVGDEGGFAPNFKSSEEALAMIEKAIKAAGYDLGSEVALGLDVAATEFYKKGKYNLEGEGKILSSEQMIDYYEKLVSKFPIVSIEDGMAEDDWDGWIELTSRLGNRVQLVGDDLFVTNTTRLKQGIDHKAANAILIKVNQIGTLTETLDAVQTAQKAGFGVVLLPPLGRDGRLHDRGPRRRHQRGPDQDGLLVPLRPHRQVQPADPHRGTTGRQRPLCGQDRLKALGRRPALRIEGKKKRA